jgi:hypothetical protein
MFRCLSKMPARVEPNGEEASLTHGAPLTHDEQITLRRVAYGQSTPGTLPARDIERLRALGLVEGPPHAPAVTPSGRRCFESLSGPAALGQTAFEQMLANTLQSLRTGRKRPRR